MLHVMLHLIIFLAFVLNIMYLQIKDEAMHLHFIATHGTKSCKSKLWSWIFLTSIQMYQTFIIHNQYILLLLAIYFSFYNRGLHVTQTIGIVTEPARSPTLMFGDEPQSHKSQIGVVTSTIIPSSTTSPLSPADSRSLHLLGTHLNDLIYHSIDSCC